MYDLIIKNGLVATEHDVLPYEADLATQVRERVLADVGAIDLDRTALRIVKTRHQPDERRLAAA